MAGEPVAPPSTKKLPTYCNEESLGKHPVHFSREQPLLLCLHTNLKSSLTSHGHYCCVMYSHTILYCINGHSTKQKDSPILGKLVRITSLLLVYKNLRVSKVSGLRRALRLQKVFAEEKTKPTDLKMSVLYLKKSLLNISVIVFHFWSGLFPCLTPCSTPCRL